MCPNCSASVTGGYCAECGQKVIQVDELTLGHFGRQVAEEVGAFDFKTVRSLVSLLRPGGLTSEYLAGRRQRYLSPLRVYFLAAAIFFLAAPWIGLTFEGFVEQGNSGQLTRMVEARIAVRGLDRAHFADRFDLRLQTIYTLSLSVSVVATAVILAALYWRRRLPFGAHVIFSLHYVAFLYLAAIVAYVLRRLVSPTPLMDLVLVHAIIGLYLAPALRRVYGGSWLMTIVKLLAIFVITFLVDSVVNALALLATLYLV